MSEINDNHVPVSPQIETSMQKVGEAFVELRSAVNRTHYGKPSDIKATINGLLACVVEMAEVVE